MDEFYPFGAVIDNQSKVKPISVFFEEYPDSQTLIQQLEEVIMSGIYKNEYIKGAVGINVYISSNSDKEKIKKSAIEIREYSIEDVFIRRFLYSKNGKENIFEDSEAD